MKVHIESLTDGSAVPSARREILKAAIAGAALTAFPAARILASTKVSTFVPAIAMGYCKPSHLAMKASASNDTVIDAFSVAPTPATYLLRVSTVSTNAPVALTAQYPDGGEHTFWQAWSESGMLQYSSPIAIRWWANNRSSLPLVVHMGGSSTLTQVTAQSGTYVLAISPSAQRLPAWTSLALRNDRLVNRTTGIAVPFSYAIFAVDAI